ncbi:hypothetical protein Dfri01_20270 [Dyadobacter frigoris]|nr:hypothetical protein Dfri01_20270 [Dyadobacter frigoris]
MVPGTYVLVVLAPSLIYQKEYGRIKKINNFVFTYFEKPECRAINTVKIFVDPAAFKEKAKFNFDADEEYYRTRRHESEIFEMK